MQGIGELIPFIKVSRAAVEHRNIRCLKNGLLRPFNTHRDEVRQQCITLTFKTSSSRSQKGGNTETNLVFNSWHLPACILYFV